MTDNLKRYQEAKTRVEKLERKKHQAEGKVQELTKQLRDKFGYGSIAEGKRALRKLNKEATAAEKEFEDALEKFENEWTEEDE